MLAIVSNWRRIARFLPVAATAGVLSVSAAIAQQQTQTLTVVLTELQFNPKTIVLTVGQPVQLIIQNKGLADHNLASRDEADSLPISNVTYQKADNDPRQLRMYEATRFLDTDVNSGTRRSSRSRRQRSARSGLSAMPVTTRSMAWLAAS